MRFATRMRIANALSTWGDLGSSSWTRDAEASMHLGLYWSRRAVGDARTAESGSWMLRLSESTSWTLDYFYGEWDFGA